jgi:hypothetical protein
MPAATCTNFDDLTILSKALKLLIQSIAGRLPVFADEVKHTTQKNAVSVRINLTHLLSRLIRRVDSWWQPPQTLLDLGIQDDALNVATESD